MKNAKTIRNVPEPNKHKILHMKMQKRACIDIKRFYYENTALEQNNNEKLP